MNNVGLYVGYPSFYQYMTAIFKLNPNFGLITILEMENLEIHENM